MSLPNNNLPRPTSKFSPSPVEKKSATSPNKKNRKLLYTKRRAKRLDQAKFVLYKRKDARNIALLSPQIAVPTSVQKNMEQNLDYKKYTKFIMRREELGAEMVWREQQKEKTPTSGNSARLHIKANNTTYHPIKFEEEFLREKRVDKAKKKLLLQNLHGAISETPGQIFKPQHTLFYAAEAYTRDFLINLSPAQLIIIKQKFILYKLKTEKHDEIIVNATGFINALSSSTTVKNNRLAIAGEYINHENGDKFKKYNVILRLFDRVDINCKGNISWNEFMSYLADSADNDAIIGVNSTGNNEKDMFKLLNNTVIPSVLHIKYIQPLDCIIGYGGDKFDGIGCFYSNSDIKKCRKVNIIGKQYGKVLSTTVAIELSYLIACFANLTIVCYDIFTLEEKATVSVLHEVSCLEYIDTKEFAFLAVGDVTGAIHCFDLRTGMKIKSFKVHAEQISGLMYLKKMNSILTCSIDGYVKFRKLIHFRDDLKIKNDNNNNSNSSGNICPDGDNDAGGRDGDIRSFFAHDGGVLKMVYSKKLRIIVTSGSNRTIKAWSPYSLDEVGIFVGHVEPVHNMEIICSSQRLITVDTSGILKIWNLRTFLPVQSIATSTNSMIQKLAKRYPSMVYDSLSQHIIVTNGRLMRYHVDEPTLLDKTHNNPILFSIINIELETLVTCSSNEITYWDLMTGNILNSIDVGDVFENQNETLSAICSLKAGRKIVLGGTKGTVKIICTKTCLIIKKVKSHLSEVTSLIFCPMSNLLLVLSRDGILRRYDTCGLHPVIEVDHNDSLYKWSNRNNNTKNNLSPIDRSQNNDVLGMAYSWNLCLIATYASDGTICLWDAVTFKIIGICDKQKHQSDIAKVIFLDPYPAFVSVGNDGIMKLFTIRPHHTPYICIMETYNDIGQPVHNKNSKNDISTKQHKKTSVSDDYSGFTTVIWDHAKFQLVTGDLDGNITTWSIKWALRSMKLRPYFRKECERALLNEGESGNEQQDIMELFERVGWIEDYSLDLDAASIGLNDTLNSDSEDDQNHLDDLEVWKEFHGDSENTVNDELAVFAATNWKQKFLNKTKSDIDAVMGTMATSKKKDTSVQNALALLSDANKGKERNEEIDLILKAAHSKDTLRQLSFVKYALQSSRLSKYRQHSTTVCAFKQLKTWKAHQKLVSSFLLFSGSNIIISTSFDGIANVWNTDNALNLETFFQGGAAATWSFPSGQCFRKYRDKFNQRLERVVSKQDSRDNDSTEDKYENELLNCNSDKKNITNSNIQMKFSGAKTINYGGPHGDTQPLTPRKVRIERLKNQRNRFLQHKAKHTKKNTYV